MAPSGSPPCCIPSSCRGAYLLAGHLRPLYAVVVIYIYKKNARRVCRNMEVRSDIDAETAELLATMAAHPILCSFFCSVAHTCSDAQISINIVRADPDPIVVARMLMPFNTIVPSDIPRMFVTDSGGITTTDSRILPVSLDDRRMVYKTANWISSLVRVFFTFGSVFYRMVLRYDNMLA